MLNRDAILKLSPDELNVAIWLAHGWVKLPPPAMPGWQKPTKNGMMGWYWEDTPDYANSIETAWELVEEMHGDSVCVVADGMKWECNWVKDYDVVGCVIQDTAPLAISRAWLIWKQEAENDHSNSNLS